MTRTRPPSLGIPKNTSPISSNITSPTDPGSAPSSPRGAVAGISDPTIQMRANSKEQSPLSTLNSQGDAPASPEFTSLPQLPASPKDGPKSNPESAKRFFSNIKASKSSSKVHTTSESTIRQVSEELSRSKIDLSDGSVYSRPSPGSTPDLSVSAFDDGPSDDIQTTSTPSSLPLKDPIRKGSIEPAGQGKKPKPRFGNLIGRTRSIRMDDSARPVGIVSGRGDGRRGKPITPVIITNTPQIYLQYDGSDGFRAPSNTPMTPMTAPLPAERLRKEDGSPGPRNRSAERGRENLGLQDSRHPHSGLANSSSGTFRDGAGSHLFNNIRNTSSRAAGGLNKAGKGIMAKMNRSGSSNNNKEEERYVCRVIMLPLIEQTRKTRIATRLENSKDKTEFWMPALPWRCIDYLNFRGCEEEGLYRVPGSDKEIRAWQKRFDQEGDINLFDEDNLYDINVIGSLFKSWLRELPTEIFPKHTQIKIHQAHPDATEVPQMMKDELSLLPPWNYYLLFAITCHLSLLTAYADKNRMSYNNLVICFQPCLRIDAFCFQFLVNKWRDCWQGCWTEKKCMEDEYEILDQMGRGANGPPIRDTSVIVGETRGTSSAGSSGGGSNVVHPSTTLAQEMNHPPPKVSAFGTPNAAHGRTGNRPPALNLATDQTTVTTSGVSSSLGRGQPQGQHGHARSPSQLPELAPVQPLSPIGF